MTEIKTAAEAENSLYYARREVENLGSLLNLINEACVHEVETLGENRKGMEKLQGVMELAVKQAGQALEAFEPLETYLAKARFAEKE